MQQKIFSFFLHNPLASFLLAYTFGIAGMPFWSLISSLGGLCLLAFITYRFHSKQIALSLVLHSCIVACGFWHISYRQQLFHHAYEQFHQSPLSITGIITDILPANTRLQQKIQIQLTTCMQDAQERIFPFSVMLFTHPTHTLQVGDTIQINNVSPKKPRSATMYEYQLRTNVIANLFVAKNNITLVSRPNFSLYQWIHSVKTNVARRLCAKMSRATYALFASIFLGIKQTSNYLFSHTQRLFGYWGITHYLARSGLHLLFIAMILQYILRSIGCSFFLQVTVGWMACALYVVLSWSSVSLLRSFSMITLYCLYRVTGQTIQSLHIFCLVTFAYLIINPFLLFALDFQLSFGLTLGLLLFSYVKRS